MGVIDVRGFLVQVHAALAFLCDNRAVEKNRSMTSGKGRFNSMGTGSLPVRRRPYFHAGTLGEEGETTLVKHRADTGRVVGAPVRPLPPAGLLV